MGLLEDKMRVWIGSAKFVKPVPGVYVLYGRGGDPIYIGGTANLEATFTEYVDTGFGGRECLQKTSTYQREFADDPQGRQAQLLSEYREQYGKTPECNSIRVET